MKLQFYKLLQNIKHFFMKSERTIIYLYWYRPRENFANHIDSYLNGNIHFSSWKNVNDPMEGYFTYFPQKDTIQNLISEKNRYKICCFSKHYSNYLLWSHYAKDHKGVCLEYEFDTKNFPYNLIKKDIIYRKEIPNFNSKLPIKDQAVIFLSKKLIFWKYEEETRLLLYDSNNSDIPISSFGKLKSITFGCNFFTDADENHSFNLACYKSEDKTKNIYNEIKSYKKANTDIELYHINSINPDGTMTRTTTKRFD